MVFKHTEDIDIHKKVSAEKLDKLLKIVINRTSNALLDSTYSTPETRSLLAAYLQTFFSTHRSIRVLIGRYEKEFELGMDAKSLAREQVEKIFAISLIISDPQKWTQAHVKNNWKKMYERHLLSKTEQQNLKRCQESNEVSAHKMEAGRIMSGVTIDEKSAIEFMFFNFDQDLPSNLKGQLIKDFPMPGRIRKLVIDASQKSFLDRWYREYKMLCGYTHLGSEKLLMQALEKRWIQSTEEKKNQYFEKEILPTFPISYTAAICACTEIYQLLAHDINVLGELITLWKELENYSLLGKVFWNIRAKELLPCL